METQRHMLTHVMLEEKTIHKNIKLLLREHMNTEKMCSHTPTHKEKLYHAIVFAWTRKACQFLCFVCPFQPPGGTFLVSVHLLRDS